MDKKKRKRQPGWAFITTQVPKGMKEEINRIRTEKGWMTEGEFCRDLFRLVILQDREKKAGNL